MAPKKKNSLENDLWWQRIKLGCAWGFAGMASIVFIIVCGGDYTRTAREYLGLSLFVADEGGVFIECGKDERGVNKFCRRDYSSPIRSAPRNAEPSWKRPDDSLPFSLSNDR